MSTTSGTTHCHAGGVAPSHEVAETSHPADPPTSSPPALTVRDLASRLHEEWRSHRLLPDGAFDPRVKPTAGVHWIAAHGRDEVDIANTSYDELPADWQAENRDAAEVIVGLIARGPALDFDDQAVRSDVGEEVHRAWLTRNLWAAGGELDVHFDDLHTHEQAKDLNQVLAALPLSAPGCSPV